MRALLLALLSGLSLTCHAQQAAPPSADEIMARVAANQDRAEAERARYVYVQHARVLSRKGRTVMCEEVTDSRIVPTVDGSKSELLTISGRQWKKDRYISYHQLPKQTEASASKDDKDSKEDKDDDLRDSNIDLHLVEGMRDGLVKDKSKDGLAARLFPLTSKNQREYQYLLVGREQKNGREVFHIRFQPKDKDEFIWKGEAWIDTSAFQPVVISTAMARKVPFVARTMLGTNVPGLGFTIVYAPQADGIWFPTSFGSEFGLRIFFLFHRTIVIDAQNRDFEKTHVTSRIVEAEATAPLQ